MRYDPKRIPHTRDTQMLAGPYKPRKADICMQQLGSVERAQHMSYQMTWGLGHEKQQLAYP